MKKTLLSLLLSLVVTISFAQKNPPTGTTFKTISAPQFGYNTLDSVVWIYKGVTYKWTDLASMDKLKHKIDSVMNLLYKKAQIDAILPSKAPATGSTSYIWNQKNTPQNANINIAGSINAGQGYYFNGAMGLKSDMNFNTTLGSAALDSITIYGVNNTGSGAYSLRSAKYANGNTANGYSART